MAGGARHTRLVVVVYFTVTEPALHETLLPGPPVWGGCARKVQASLRRAKERALSVGGDGRITERALDPGDEARPRSREAVAWF